MSERPYIRIRNFINGTWVETPITKDGKTSQCDTAPLYNPSTGACIGEVPLSDADTVEQAIASAHEAYRSWKHVPIAKRISYLYKIHACMVRDLEKLAQSIAYDQAKHISEARGEVQRVIEILEMAGSIPAMIQGDTVDQIAQNISVKIVKQSLGVFGGVAPFNFPALVFGWFIPFAIGAGNTFIYKPSTLSPYFMQHMCEIFMEIELPAGVVNVVHGNRNVPEAWYEDARMAGVCLVGSTPTAKSIAAGCAKGAKRSMLLGGAKNMLLVMEDADIDVFINNFLISCYGSAGQRCLAGSIVAIVPELYETVLERMVEASKNITVGDAFDPEVFMGPLISKEALATVSAFVDKALAHGACKLILDGRNPELPQKNQNGYFIGPTILRDVTPCNPLFTTEVFGPVVAAIQVADMQDALNLIRSSEFGNGACIFTQSQHYAEVFSREADVGMVGINIGVCAPHPYAPFGGIKGSLLGTNKVQGKCGIDFFVQDKVTSIRTVGANIHETSVSTNPSVRSCVAS